MDHNKRSDFLNISKNISSSKEKELAHLIQRREGSNANELKNVLEVIDGFSLSKPDSRQNGKLQFQFTKSVTAIESGYYHQFHEMPISVQNTINALAFLFACLKFHGFCVNEMDYPILTGADKLENHLGLYDVNDELVALGHCYDDDTYKPVLPIPKVEPCISDELIIHHEYCEVALNNNDQKTLIALKNFLEKEFMLKQITPRLG